VKQTREEPQHEVRKSIIETASTFCIVNKNEETIDIDADKIIVCQTDQKLQLLIRECTNCIIYT